jgi:hypothetical protein
MAVRGSGSEVCAVTSMHQSAQTLLTLLASLTTPPPPHARSYVSHPWIVREVTTGARMLLSRAAAVVGMQKEQTVDIAEPPTLEWGVSAWAWACRRATEEMCMRHAYCAPACMFALPACHGTGQAHCWCTELTTHAAPRNCILPSHTIPRSRPA